MKDKIKAFIWFILHNRETSVLIVMVVLTLSFLVSQLIWINSLFRTN